MQERPQASICNSTATGTTVALSILTEANMQPSGLTHPQQDTIRRDSCHGRHT